MRPLAKVLLADNGRPARLMLRLDLERDGRIAVVGEAGTGPEAVELTAVLKPDVVILDPMEWEGVDATIEAMQTGSPGSKIIALTTRGETPATARAHARLDRRTSAQSIASALLTLCRR
jgi:DNA-binding NarL/FixJ family response regulator